MQKTIFIACAALFLAGSFGFASSASAQTVEQLQAQIQSLLATVAQLQSQLAQMQGQPAQWCHTFNTNMGVGFRGTEAGKLNHVLLLEGFDPFGTGRLTPNMPQGEDTSGAAQVFTEFTASAVVGFQEKYKSEILTPLGLKYGTGYVGPATRAKLNSLYGCARVIPPPPPSARVSLQSISPASGPVGTIVTIYGRGFTSVGNTVNFGTGVAGVNLSSNGSSVIFTVPQTLSLHCIPFPCGAPAMPVGPGDYKVSITNANGTSNSLVFTVPAEPNSAPIIDSVNGPSQLEVLQEGKWVVRAHDPDLDKLNYYVQWEQGGGTEVSPLLLGTTQQKVIFTHVYPRAGIYAITFQVTDSRESIAFLQGKATATFVVTVGNVSQPSTRP